MNPAPRSRSSDNLEKYSPASSRKDSGDMGSPLTRRLTGDSLFSKGKSDNSFPETLEQPTSLTDTLSKGICLLFIPVHLDKKIYYLHKIFHLSNYY